MAKVVSSYSSVVRGVSEQVPQDRHPGQMFEQINMVSDPVRGTVRRQGSRLMHEIVWQGGHTYPISETVAAELRKYREHSFFMEGKEYSLLYRSAPSTSGLPMAMLFDKDAKQWIPVTVDSDASMNVYKAQGFSSVTTVGQFLVAAGNQTLPSYTQVDAYLAQIANGVVWIRAGSYSRTYSVTITSGASVWSASYTTMASSYPVLLDTSDIPSSDPEYQKKVNDRVYAWQSASNKWIGDAFASQQPNNIANQLRNGLIAAGMPPGAIAVDNGTLYTNVATTITGSDGGDGSQLRVVFNEIEAPDLVSSKHYTGKLVKVRAKGQSDAYYLKAVPDNPGQTFGSVTWTEAPAITITPTSVFAMGAFNAGKTAFYLAANRTRLQTLSGKLAPAYGATKAGDLSTPGNKPYFLDHPISLLTVFQDRLIIVSNGVVFMSKVGDYFEWFRRSMLSLPADDPGEGYALGSEDDIISRAVTYNRDLFLFGLRNQYAISGRTALTPSSLAIITSASENSASFAAPKVLGNLLFYGRYEEAKNQVGPSKYAGNVAQFQLGVFQDTPEVANAAPQLDKYIKGRPVEFATITQPTTLFARTDGVDNGLYVFRFLDQPGTQVREFDSWSRWKWDYNSVGHVVGFVGYRASLFVYTVKSAGTDLWLGAEEFVMDSSLSDTPYADSQRTYASYTEATGFLRPTNTAEIKDLCSVALDAQTEYQFLGATATNAPAFYTQYTGKGVPASSFIVGVNYDSLLDITPPYVRDQNDRALVSGNLTVTQYTVSVVDTGGMDAIRTSEGMDTTVSQFNGRVLGRANNLVGRQPITSTNITVPCGKANIRHRMRFESRNWLPMGISAIEWTGQLFMNSKRV